MPSEKKTKKRRRAEQSADNQRPSVSDVRQPYFLSRYTLLSLALIIVIGLLVYANTFNSPFVYDDTINILNNPFIRLSHISAAKLKNVLNSPGFRPLANLTFAANYYFHQYDVTGYHIVNVMIHLINAFLLFLLTRQTMSLCRMDNTWIALPAALLWLVNPVHTQSVTYIVQRMNSLATMFYLLAMVCYIQGRLIQRQGNRPALSPAMFFTAASLAGLFGLVSKEITATLPVMIFLYEWYFFQNLNRDWFKKQTRWIIVMAILLIIVALIYLKGDPLAALASKYAREGFSLSQRLLTEPGVVLYYLSLLLYPSPDRLRIIYQISPATSLFSPANTLLPLIALAGLITISLRLRHKNRLISFAVVWFLVNLIIESSFIPVALAFEHRTYLPSVFPFIATACFLFRRTTAQKAIGIISAAVIICGFWTLQRNAVWADTICFWSDAVRKTPSDATAQNNLGTVLIALDRPAEAMPVLEKAIYLDPNYEKAHYNLGLSLTKLERLNEAEASYHKALELNPSYEEAHINIGYIKMIRGRTDEAMEHFKKALNINPHRDLADKSKSYIAIAIILINLDRPAEAIPVLEKAIYLDPDSEEAHYNLGLSLTKLGRLNEAEASYHKALKLNPSYEEAHTNIGYIKMIRGRTGEAMEHFKKALAINPYFEKAYFNIANACFRTGETEQAMTYLNKALSIKPDYAEATDSLNIMTRALKQYGQVITRLQRERQLHADDPEIALQLANVCMQAGIEDSAVDLYQQALILDSNCEKCMDVLTRIFIARGRYDLATQMLERLASLHPDNPNFFYSLACAYAHDNQTEKAVENLKKAVAGGFDDIDYIRRDENMAAIRDTDYFQSLTAGEKN